MRRAIAMLRLVLSAALPELARPMEAAAQPLWIGDPGRSAFMLEVVKPDFEGDDGLTFLSTAWFAGGRLRLAPGATLVAELPFATVKADDAFGGDSESAVGNPYLGLELRMPDPSLHVGLGARIPLVSEEDAAARLFGLFADLNRWEAWIDDVVPLYANLQYQTLNPDGFGTRAGGGPVAWISTGNSDSELLGTYTLQAIYRGPRFEGAIGLDGRVLFTEGDPLADGRTQHELVLSASPVIGRSRPGLQLRLPLGGDLADVVDFTVAVHVAVMAP